MEPLSSAASVIAVVSVAIRLADSAKQLCDFWSSIKEAPDDVQTIATEVELLSGILSEIALEAQRVPPDETLSRALKACAGVLEKLRELTNDLEPGFASNKLTARKWTAFRAVWKSGKFKKIQDSLERLKSTTILAQNCQYSRLTRIRHETGHQSLMTITRYLSRLSMPQTSTNVTAISGEYSDGRGYLNTETNYLADPFLINSQIDQNRWASSTDVVNTAEGISVGPRNRLHSPESAERELPPQSCHSRTYSNRSYSSKAKKWEKHTLTSHESLMHYFFGTIYTSSAKKCLKLRESNDRVYQEEQDLYEDETLFTVRPATWLIRLGMKYGLNLAFSYSSISGWKQSLTTFSPVPDDSLIFEFCQEGNLPAIRSLFSRGLSSVKDIGSRGQTPLRVSGNAIGVHVSEYLTLAPAKIAAGNHHVEVCKFLISAGADRCLMAKRRPSDPVLEPTSPVLCAAKISRMTRAGMSRAFDTLRLFTDTLEFSESDDDGWRVLLQLCDSQSVAGGDLEAKLSVLMWLINLTRPDIECNYIEASFARMLHFLVSGPTTADAARLLLQLAPKGAIDAREHPQGFTVLQIGIAYAEQKNLHNIFSLEPDLHALSLDFSYSPEEETPMSLAMYSSWAFSLFRDGLIVNGVDLDELIYRELDHDGPLANAGWDVSNLRTLFGSYIDPDFHLQIFWEQTCYDCDCGVDEGLTIRVQPYWQRFLENIRRKSSPDLTPDHMSPSGELDPGVSSFLGRQEDSSTETTETEHIANIHTSTVESVSHVHHEPLSDSTVEEPSDLSYPTNTGITDYVYEKDEIICIYCWYNFRDSGQRPSPEHPMSPSSVADDSSDDEFSPFLFNT